ncbi:YqaJ viral recombinase family protein [Skermanella mucosa]|uniref:YqaJ viral recombinase family protein n=1 Tax=Skermanella mucosa TaxID=1789672 RepID=UPI00192B5ECE|nr:YqaJ viral recombinase family protein [Skermanella mucosa]UEM22521.1 YqaJ viral recombinase family protein [Skermanella mucosa]
MALSKDQVEFRARRLGSSDAVRVMAGHWTELWREKTGRAAPPRLDFVPVVQIGIATESLHARFYTYRTGIGAYPAGHRTHVHPDHDHIVANLDFLTWGAPPADPTAAPDTILEAKFHSGFKTDEDLAERYYWQMQHQMMVSGLARCVLSVLRPTGYSFLTVERNEADAALLLETIQAFWWHVENDLEPADPLPVEAPDFDDMGVLDMSMHNRFVAVGDVLVSNHDGVQAYRAAEAELKALMPEQAKVAYVPSAADARGIVISRSRDGRLSIRIGELPRKYRARARTWLPDHAPDFLPDLMNARPDER